MRIRSSGLTSEGGGQGESEVLDWLAEVEEGGSDWLNSFFTFLYGLINPLEPLEEEHAKESGVREEKKKETCRVHPELPVRRFRRRERRKAGTRGTQYLADEKPDVARRGAKKENPLTKDVGWKLREALKQQLAMIHERVEAKKIAKLALAEVRQLLAKEEEDKVLELRREEVTAKARERVAARLKEEEEKIEREEMEKALEKLRREKAKQQEEKGEGREKAKQQEE
ncbi:uncharacterized protein LOC144542121, partial [Centroberyx gerrardi]